MLLFWSLATSQLCQLTDLGSDGVYSAVRAALDRREEEVFFSFFFFFLMSAARMGVRTRARWAGNRTRLSSLFKHNDRGEVIEKGVVRGRLPEKKKRWSASKRQETQTGCFCCTLRSYISWLAKSCVVCTCLMFGCVCNVVIWLVDHKASQPVWTEG